MGAEALAKRWNIDYRNALNTVKMSRQRGTRHCFYPAITRRFPTNDRMLKYKRLTHPVYSDTIFSGVISQRGNKCARVFCTDYGWTRCFHLATKGEAHEACSLLFQRDDEPPEMVFDDSKEQTKGKFAKKCRETGCRVAKTETYSPWMQVAEGCTKQVKLGSSRKMIKTGTPKPLWDHCLELEGGIRSLTALDICGLQGQVPHTIMSGETAISARIVSLDGSNGSCIMNPMPRTQTINVLWDVGWDQMSM